MALKAGTRLWRVHQATLRPEQFSPIAAESPWAGGRFDATSTDPFTYLYAGLLQETALCEALLHGLAFEHGSRHLMRTSVRGRMLSCLVTTIDLTLLSLAAATDLASICQHDSWLVDAEGLDYAGTRDWASWLRKHVADAQGFIWCSRRNLPERSLVLFGDRCPSGAILPSGGQPMPLDDRNGADFLNFLLAPYRVTISHPGIRRHIPS